MSISLSTENIQTTISQLNRDFAGRTGSVDYDESKLVHIHRRNRPYVWNDAMQRNLLDSIMNGYYVPPIICCSRIHNNSERREVMEGGNRITTFRRILNGDLGPLKPEQRQRIEAHPITLVVMRNLNSKQQRIMFRRLNKNVKVSDGQLYSMSEDDSPLVKEALAFLNNDDYPLRDLITTHFFDTRGVDNDGKRHLENALALISGAMYGVNYITKSYNTQESKIECQDPIDRNHIVQTLGAVFHVFTLADSIEYLVDRRKRKGQWSVGRWLGAILYECLTNPGEIRRIQDKWARYIVRVRRNEENAEDASKMGGAQNLTATRYKRIGVKIDIFMTSNRIATEAELAVHVHPDEDVDSEASEDAVEEEVV